jgi:hypothetical protein
MRISREVSQISPIALAPPSGRRWLIIVIISIVAVTVPVWVGIGLLFVLDPIDVTNAHEDGCAPGPAVSKEPSILRTRPNPDQCPAFKVKFPLPVAVVLGRPRVGPRVRARGYSAAHLLVERLKAAVFTAPRCCSAGGRGCGGRRHARAFLFAPSGRKQLQRGQR